MTQGVCPTPGCRGVGHIKGAKYTGHHRYGMTFLIVVVTENISDITLDSDHAESIQIECDMRELLH